MIIILGIIAFFIVIGGVRVWVWIDDWLRPR